MRRTVVSGIFLMVVFFIGCVGGSKTVIMGNQFVLEYSSPKVENESPLKESLKIERFSASQDSDSFSMVYRPKQFSRKVYTYARWRVRPTDMLTDSITSDLRSIGIFTAVYSWRDLQLARFVLHDEIMEFLRVEEEGRALVKLTIRMTLSDMKGKDIAERTAFSKEYRIEEPMQSDGAEDYAAAMSKAAAKFSREMIADIYRVIKDRKPSANLQ
jgi:ABC-type uncharacterized transport system auxiliary subunit